MKIAIVGAAGMLGAVTVREWREHGHDVAALTRADLDVTNSKQVQAVISALSPDVVINCTAYNRVDDAEDEPATALAVNTWAVKSLARAAAASGAVFVHYSTDFVFDGETTRPYTEDDDPSPQSMYGMSKLLGEWFATEAARHYVLRVESLFGGCASRSTIDTMLQNFAAGRAVRAFSDRTVSPSHVSDVARATRLLVENEVAFGVYHCVNSGMATWLEVAERLRDWAGFPEAAVEPMTIDGIVLRARRPGFAALSNSKMTAQGIPMPTWQDALRTHLSYFR